MNSNIDINKSNYESFVIDYLDGNLNAVELACFIAFLENNPEIKSEVDDIENITIDPENIVYTAKSGIKKKELISTSGIDENNYEDYFIGYYEEELTPSQNSSLGLFLKQNPELNDEFEIHSKLKLAPDNNIVYPNKNQLKRKNSVLPMFYSSAAAVVIFFASFWLLTNNDGDRDQFVSISPIHTSVNINQSIALKNINSNLTDRKLHNIDLPDNIIISSNNEAIHLASLKSKGNNIQLANDIFEFARPMTQSLNHKNSVTDKLYSEQPVLASKDTKKKKSLLASVFKKQFNKVSSSFKSNKRKNSDTSPDPTYVKVLDRGILVFNTITGSETYTSKTYNLNGELTSYQIEGKEVFMRKSSQEKSTY